MTRRLTRQAGTPRAPQAYSCSTPRSPRKHNTVSADGCGSAVDNLCIIRDKARSALLLAPQTSFGSRAWGFRGQVFKLLTWGKSCIRRALFWVKLQFLWVGETKDPLFSRVEERYLKRVRQHFPTEMTIVPDLKKNNPHQQKAQLVREARQIEKKLPEKTYLIVLDSEGKEFTSPALASFLENLMNRGVSAVTFLVGGHLGVHEKIRESADQKMSLTKMTLPHELARVVLLEQIYRAVTIIKALPYHK